ncbi:MAG: hypothetical protein KAH23_09010 [Kiritimatiellae bacterium]|nr:hypothetical protein [Kiritimatiellia bacterium]
MTGMKKTMIILFTGLFLFLSITTGAHAQGSSRVGFAFRRHNKDSALKSVKFGDDLSYMLSYELEEQQAFWQIAVDYAPEIDTTNSLESIITPQLNLLFKDKGWLGGVGVLWSLIEEESGEDEWSDAYYQLILGFSLPVLGLKFNISAYYQFDNFNDIESFEEENIDYAVWFKYAL